MWTRLFNALRPAPRQDEVIADAISLIHSRRSIICNTPAALKAEKDQQLRCFDRHRIDIFAAYATIAEKHPLQAIRILLELEIALKPHAQTSFWEIATFSIPETLRNATPDIKNEVYKYLLNHAHKGKISSFILSQADDFSTLLNVPKNAHDPDFIETLLSHAAPQTAEFLETFRLQFENIYAHSAPDHKLALTKKLFKACCPINGKDKAVTPPDYVEDMRLEQIKHLSRRIIRLNSFGDQDYKHITNCIQDLETLKAGKTDLLSSVKSDKADKSKFRFYLYKLDIPAPANVLTPQSTPDHLYVLAKRVKSHLTHEDNGKVSTILVTKDSEMVDKAFSTLAYDNASKQAVKQLASQINSPSYSAVNMYATKTPHYTLTPLNLSLHALFMPVSQLTLGANGVNLPHDHTIRHQHWDLLPLQHNQPREIQ